MKNRGVYAALACLLSVLLTLASLPAPAFAESLAASDEALSEQDPLEVSTEGLSEDTPSTTDTGILEVQDTEETDKQDDTVAIDAESSDGNDTAAIAEEDDAESTVASETDKALEAQADSEIEAEEDAKSLATATVDTISEQTYTGNPITPELTVTLEDTALIKDVDYTVSYSQNLKVGTAQVTIKGLGAYTGNITTSFEIVAAPISGTDITPIAKQAYTGKAVKPLPTIVFNGTTLKRGTDYTLSYKNYTKVGTATIVISGKGNFTGTKSVTYRIVKPSVRYRTHVQRIGWQSWVGDGTPGGTSGQSLRLEAINIKLNNQLLGGGIQYRTHVQRIGWQGWKKDGARSGTSGQSLRLEAIQIKLYGEMAKYYDVYYRVHAQYIGWMGWAKNGEMAGTSGYSWRLEALQIVLVLKDGAAPSTSLEDQVQRIPNRFIKYTSESYKTLARYGISYQSWGLSDSPMVTHVHLSPNHSGKRNHTIDTITPHYAGGYCTCEALGWVFDPVSRQASSNYGIGYDGRVGMYVNECNRAWTSGSGANDNRAITIECANRLDGSLTSETWSRLVSLCADLCMRNGKTRLVYRGSADYTGLTNADMLLTMHKWFQWTDCPGPWLSYQFDRLANEVNAQLAAARL